MRDFKRNKGRITDEGYALHCNVSMIAAAVIGGASMAAIAGTVATVGAGVMAAGSVLGIKEAAPIGGLMMAGGGIVAGGAGLMAGGMGTLGTLSAGSQLVGGALQGVGILTGNNKLSNIGGLINAGGMVGTSFDSGVLSGKGVDSGVVKTSSADTTDWGMMNTGSKTPASVTIDGGTQNVSYGLDKAAPLPGATPPPSGIEAMLGKMEKYKTVTELAGKFATGMSTAKSENDKLAAEQNMYNQTLAAQKQWHTAVAIPGQIPVSAPATPGAVQPIDPNYYHKPLSTGLIAQRVG